MHSTRCELSIVVGTFNRRDQIKRCVESVLRETRTPFRLYITDAGSTDGTIDYLEEIANARVIPILTGRRLGQAKAYNEVFAIVDTQYVCWLSDDNEIINNGLDVAVNILKANSTFGMVALKTKDKQGPFVDAPYIGGISVTGILNANQGVLPTKVLQQAGGFSENFRDYGIDPALTAEVLFLGYKVVYTKSIALLHFRNWNEDPNSQEYRNLKERHLAAAKLYSETYGTWGEANLTYQLRRRISRRMRLMLALVVPAQFLRGSAFARDIANTLSCRYISIFDPLLTLGKSYHLVQRIKGDPKHRRPSRETNV